MAKADGRIEQGQSIKSAFSASKWNDLCDAADVVLGRNGGTAASPVGSQSLRQVLTCVKGDAQDVMLPGHAVAATAVKWSGSSYMPTFQDPPETLAEFSANVTDEDDLRKAVAMNGGTRNPPSPFTVTLYDSSVHFTPDISPPLGFVTEPSLAGDKTVRVCVSGVTLALARVFESQVTQAGANRVLAYNTLVRGRSIYSGGTAGAGTFYDNHDGVMDVGPGGSVMLLSLFIVAPTSWPAYCWMWCQI